jgi:hypothetical protein
MGLLTLTEVYVNWNVVKVCEHTVKMAPHNSFEPEEGTGQRDGWTGWREERKLLSEANIRALSGGQNELIGEFKMMEGDIIGIRV